MQTVTDREHRSVWGQVHVTASKWGAKFDRFDAFIVLTLVASSVVVSTLSFAPKKFGDMNFHTETKVLSLAIHGAAPWSDVAITRAPAPVFYYLVPYLAVPAAAGDDAYWLGAFTWTILWMSLSALLIRRTGQMIGGPTAGKLAVLLTVLSPFQIYYSHGVTAESPAYIGIVLLTYGFFRWQRVGADVSPFHGAAWLVWIGLSLFVLSRPNACLILVIGLLAAAAMWRLPEKRREAKFIISSISLASLAIAATFICVALFLKGQQNANLAHVVFHGRFQYRTEPWDWRFWDDATRQGSVDYAAWVKELVELKRQSAEEGLPLAALQWRWAGKDAIEHPGLTLQMAAIRLLPIHLTLINSRKPEAFKFGPVQGRAGYVAFHVLVNAINFVLIIGSVWFLFTRRTELAANWPLWGPWLALLLFHIATYAEPRYLLPSRPGLIIMTTISLTTIIRRPRDHLIINQAVAGSASP